MPAQPQVRPLCCVDWVLCSIDQVMKLSSPSLVSGVAISSEFVSSGVEQDHTFSIYTVLQKRARYAALAKVYCFLESREEWFGLCVRFSHLRPHLTW
jgi:hypothetical protein